MENLIQTMPESARIWLYASDRAFTSQEADSIHHLLSEFVKGWNSHGAGLVAEATLLHNQIILFVVDESKTPPSGCSIDKSVALLRHIEKNMGVSLLDGGRIFYKNADGIVALRLPQIKHEIEKQAIKADTLILNTQAGTLEMARRQLFVPAGESWMARYFR